MQVSNELICSCRGLKVLIKEAQQEMEQQGTVAFSPRTTSLTVTRPRGQKPADERFFEKLENEARNPFAILWGNSPRNSPGSSLAFEDMPWNHD